MLQSIVVGYIGADAVTKNENGKEFTTLRVANTDRWTDANGQTHEDTQWVDVILSGQPKVVEFLKKGTLVFVQGRAKLRCYSSEKARGFVAGITISAQVIELLGGSTDQIPSRLYDASGAMHDVQKWYLTDVKDAKLTNGRGREFVTDDNGWVYPIENVPQEVQQAVSQEEPKETKPGKK